MCDKEIVSFNMYDTLEIHSINTGYKVKRRNKDGGVYTLDTLYLNTGNYTHHRDYLSNVNSCDYIILED